MAGVGGYGNCLGLPNIGGEVVFDPSYAGNPLVNALCLGVLPHERLQTAKATGVGNRVILLGAKTGRDGIGGVSVLASATFEEDGGPSKRPSVQVGDPFTEKVVTECCLELFERGLTLGIQDLGGAGLACATSETAAAGLSGMAVALDRVPLREASMSPLEVITSESQERMLAIVRPQDVDETLALCERWGVLATVIGEVTEGDRLVLTWHGEVVADVPPASLADEGPVYQRPMRRPADLDALQADAPERLPRPSTGEEMRQTLLALVSSANLASRRWVTEQYDRYVLGNTVLAMPDDAGVVRIDEETGLAVALALDGNGRYARLDPYAGAQLALSEAYRNVAVTGARPVAVTNCLNFGSPEDPEVMWQFAEAVRGLADGCQTLGTPVTGGNVSFYNQTGTTAINPTPVVGVLGVLDDAARRTPMAFAADGELLYLLGETADELGGSEWAWAVHRHLGGRPPRPRLDAEARLAEILVAGSRDGMSRPRTTSPTGGWRSPWSSRACAGGGAPASCCPSTWSRSWHCSASRPRARSSPCRAARRCGSPRCAPPAASRRARIGVVDGDTLEVQGQFTASVDDLRAASERTLPALFG